MILQQMGEPEDLAVCLVIINADMGANAEYREPLCICAATLVNL